MIRERPAAQRRILFVAAYLKCLNERQAAIEAGYSPTSAKQAAQKLMARPDVLAAIAKGQAQRAARTEITQDRVLRELALLAFSSIDNYDVDDFGHVTVKAGVSPNRIRAVQSVKYRVTTDAEGRTERTTEFKLWDKPGPLKLAGRHTGLFNERELTREQLEREVDDRIAELVRQERERRGQTTALTVTAGRGTE